MFKEGEENAKECRGKDAALPHTALDIEGPDMLPSY